MKKNIQFAQGNPNHYEEFRKEKEKKKRANGQTFNN